MQTPSKSRLIRVFKPPNPRRLRWHGLVAEDGFMPMDRGLPSSVCASLDAGYAPTGPLRQMVLTHADADHIGDDVPYTSTSVRKMKVLG
jgi:mRNA degradation ribonuclease J1/J2